MNRFSKTIALLAAIMLLLVQACNDILTEHPKTAFTADYFKTGQGLQDGLNAAYAYLRFQYGTNPALGLNVVGTDEFTFGPEPNYNGSGDNLPHKQLGQYTLGASHGFLLVTYSRVFTPINTINGLLEFAPTVSELTEQERGYIIAQARYLRAHYYYMLVSQFGASPIDLGAGEFKFNTIPFAGFNKLDPDLLKKNFQEMIDDLTFASQSEYMVDARRPDQFKISKATALHLLAKIYLFRAYSSVAEANDFEMAYETAKEVIDNQGKYGVALMQDFGAAYKQGNDYNAEIIFAAERIPKDQLNNDYPAGGPSGIGDAENMAANCFTSNYQQPRLVTPSGGVPIDGRPFNYQRPLRKICPTAWLTNVAFADKVNDSRFNNSFRTLFLIDTQNAVGSTGYNTFVTNLKNMTPSRVLGDTAFYIATTVDEKNAMLAKNPYYPVYGPDNWYSNQLYPTNVNPILVYPSLKKFNDSQRGAPNDASGRPMPIFKFADTYLMAAEAAMQTGKKTEALAYIKVIRERAAYRPNLSSGELSNRVANMMKKDVGLVTEAPLTESDITLDFILDERARELCGESLRWTDLAMRGDDVFVNRVKLNPDAQAVQTFHRLRPIPQSQLDRISDTNKAKYQNPGY